MGKTAITSLLASYFTEVEGKKVRVLYDYTVVNGIQDPVILWAAALYVDRGVNIKEAAALTSTMMLSRSRKSVYAQEVRLMKKVACSINTMKKEDKIKIDFMNITFSSGKQHGNISVGEHLVVMTEEKTRPWLLEPGQIRGALWDTDNALAAFLAYALSRNLTTAQGFRELIHRYQIIHEGLNKDGLTTIQAQV